MVLVRPDLYVDYVSSLDDVEGLSGHMQQHWLSAGCRELVGIGVLVSAADDFTSVASFLKMVRS